MIATPAEHGVAITRSVPPQWDAYSRGMHSHLTFHNPPALPHDVVVGTLERALDGLDDVRSFLHLW